jgi:hypothetical protein
MIVTVAMSVAVAPATPRNQSDLSRTDKKQRDERRFADA